MANAAPTMTTRAHLHATWMRTLGEHALHVWGEALPLDFTDEPVAPRPRRGRKPAPRMEPAPHPKALDVQALRRALRSLPVSGPILEGVASSAAGQVMLCLPTAGGLPISEHDATREVVADPVTTGAWMVTALRLPAPAAARFLCALEGTTALGDFPAPRDSDESSTPGEALRVSFGHDLRVWTAASHWVLALIVRQRLVPVLVAPVEPAPKGAEGTPRKRRPAARTTTRVTDDGAEGARARWLPVLDSPEDQRRLALLSDALPAAARCGRHQPTGPDADGGLVIPTARTVLTQFVSLAVEGLAPEILAERPAPLTKLPATWPDEAAQWTQALAAGRGDVPGPAGALRRFATELGRWSRDTQVGSAEATFRTCFRLVPPGPSDSSEEAVPRGKRKAEEADDWKIEILLQAVADPSVMLPARDVWRSEGAGSRASALEHPQERLLRDLGRASRVFPELARTLRTAKPTSCALEPNEAVRFLREVGWVLQESGFGVLLPSRMAMGQDAMGLRLRVKSKQEKHVGKGLFGLASLVEYEWDVSLGDAVLSEEEFRTLAALKTPLVQVRGQWVLLDPEGVDRVLRAWDRSARDERLTLGDTLRLSAGLAQPGLPSVDISFEGVLAGLAGEERLQMLPTPAEFRGELRPYQARGLSWLCYLAERGLGACLADDMGLGKTIELIAMLLARRPAESGPRSKSRTAKTAPTLLICPTSLLGNWQRELARFAPQLRVLIHHGSDRVTGAGFKKATAGHDVVLTSYGLALRDQESLEAVAWEGMVLDEAQAIKNPAARQTRAVRGLRAGFRVAMTGTPVENRLTDLWSLMEFLNPGLLGSREQFRGHFVIPVEQYGNQERAEELKRAVQPFILRRLKSDPTIIQDLPDKLEMKVYCSLTREQATLYQATLDEMMRKIEDSEEDAARRGLVLATMMRLKQICNHPAQFLGDGSALARRSGKLARLEEMLEEVLEAGDRALVFTQFTDMGKSLQRHLEERLGTEVLFLSGDTPRVQRDRMVESFQSESGPRVFLLSLKAGGVGLNLTRASHVFHYDRWWNPAVENQATDRAYRIGQKSNVQVHKYICQGTLEETIDALIESKVALAESVVGQGEGWLTELGNAQLREILALRTGAVEEDPT